jgi:nitroreductase
VSSTFSTEVQLKVLKAAQTSVPIHPLLAQRWSPRGFDLGHHIDDQTVLALLEAARWAPSAANSQPWRFLVARRDEPAFEQLLAVLSPTNRPWAERASALVLVAAEVVDAEGKTRPWAHYDTGQAVAALTIQAEATGLAAHQMGGFDAAAAARQFGLDSSLSPVVVVALGRRDEANPLPEPYAARETASRGRSPLSSLLLVPGTDTAGTADQAA